MMTKVNTHGLKLKGLKKASGATENYGYYSGMYDEVFYDTKSGEIWTVFQSSYGQNSWTEYHDPSVIKVCNASSHMTMQQLANAIRDALDERTLYCS